jgi:hypothetical protein
MTKLYIDVLWVILFYCVHIERFFFRWLFRSKHSANFKAWMETISPPPINMCAKCHVLVSIINKGCMSLGSVANNSLRTLGLCLHNTIIAILNGNLWPNDFVVCQLVTTKFDRLPNKLPVMMNLRALQILGQPKVESILKDWLVSQVRCMLCWDVKGNEKLLSS